MKKIVITYTELPRDYLEAAADWNEARKHPWAEWWIWRAKNRILELRRIAINGR